MSQKVQVLVLCEDGQTSSFALRYLKSKGFSSHKIRILVSPSASGSAYTYVLNNFPVELENLRKDSVSRKLLAIIDEDGRGRSIADFQEACKKANVLFRTDKEPVAILIPKRNIETWIYFLEHQSAVDETKDYKTQVHHGTPTVCCKQAVRVLDEICSGNDRANWPSSLAAACPEIQRLLQE